jgi:hypothetical protein
MGAGFDQKNSKIYLTLCERYSILKHVEKKISQVYSFIITYTLSGTSQFDLPITLRKIKTMEGSPK